MSSKYHKGIVAFMLLLSLLLAGCSALQGLTSPQPVTLRFAYLANVAEYETLARQFEVQNPHITIELIPLAGSGISLQRNLQSLAAPPDVLRIPSIALDSNLTAQLLPADAFLAADLNFPLEDFISGTLEGLQVDGRQLALPAGLNPYVVFYLPEKMAAAGVPPPSAQWTIEVFLDAAVALHNMEEGEAFAYGFCSHPGYADPVILAYLFGGGIVPDLQQFNAPMLNTPENAEALTWYASLQNEYGLLPPVRRAGEVSQYIVSGRCGFWMDWLDRSGYGQYLQGKQLAVLPLPTHRTPFGVAVLDTYAIFASSEHPDEAWLWLRFLLDQPAAAGSLIPARTSHIESQAYAMLTTPDMLALARNLPQRMVILGLGLYTDPRLGQLVELFSGALQRVMDEETDALTALEDAQLQAERIMGQ